MRKRRCNNKDCRCLFEVSPRHPNQKYCSRNKCQRVRKTQWQRSKLAHDEDYQKNQADCQARWRARHPDYYKKYREKNPEYTKRNRDKQRLRNRSKRAQTATTSILNPIAKMDALKSNKPVISGKYKLIPVSEQTIAKMDVIIVEINEITKSYSQTSHDCKERTL